MKLMFVGAHPADVFDLAGGTIYNHTERGDEVQIIVFTDGLRSHTFGKTGIVEKRAEVERAALLYGIHSVKTLGMSDSPLICNNHSIYEDIAYFIQEFRPDVVACHHPNEYSHWDHAECGKVVCRSLKMAERQKFGDSKKYKVPVVYFYAVQFRPNTVRLGFVPQSPDYLVELTESEIDKKAKVMACFESQGHTYESMRQRMDSFEGEMGRADGLRYAEGFSLYYPFKRNYLIGV